MAVLTLADALAAAATAGFTGRALAVIVAISQAESGLDTTATNSVGNSAGIDRGILQINSVYHAEVTDACAFDPACAYRAAYTISQGGTDFTPWTTYVNGAYQQFMADFDCVAPNFGSMTEFGTYNGCCGPDATLMALHTRNPDKWPLTPGNLVSLVRAEAQMGYCTSNGVQDIYQLANFLKTQSIPITVCGWDTTQNTGGAAYSVDALHAELKNQVHVDAAGNWTWGYPVIIEVYAAGAGLIEDEHGVQGHFITVAGLRAPATGWLRGDGDAVSYNDPNGGVKPPILTTWSELVTADPIAWVTVHLDPTTGGSASTGGSSAVAVPYSVVQDAQGNKLCKYNAGTLGAQFSAFVLNNASWLTADLVIGDSYYGAYAAFCSFNDGTILYWDGHSVNRYLGGYVAKALYSMWSDCEGQLAAAQKSASDLANQLAAANAQVASLKDQLAKAQAQAQAAAAAAPAPADTSAADSAAADAAAARAALAAAQAQVGSLQIQLTAANKQIAQLQASGGVGGAPAPTPDALVKLGAFLDAMGVPHK